MDVDKLAIDLLLKGMTKEQQNAALDSIKESVTQAKAIQKQRIGENVQVVVQALKKLEADIKARYDETGKAIEKRVASIKDGKDGQNGINGKDGRDGRPGRDGSTGPKGNDGLPGRNGIDGVDGVSVTNAFIDFDGSLIINLSNGQDLNVGEVVAPDLAEKIKVITNGGGTSQQVLDTLASLQTQINNLIPSQTGNSGKFLTTDGTDVSWATVSGTGTVTSVAATAGTGISVSGSPITTSGTLTITNTAPDQTVVLTASTGISTTGTYPNFTITNTAPDQTVSLTGAGTTSISGTYPNFTITSADSTVGTVTSVGGTGTVSGISLSGTVTSSGNLTLGGTLDLSSPPTIGNTTPNTGTFTTLTVNDNTTLGSSNSDDVIFNARIASNFDPATDNAYDLGRVGHEWRDLFIDGTANIDSLVADTADINGGTIDGATIGGASAAAATVTTLTATADSAFTSTGALTISKGTAAQRPGSPVGGMLRFNDDSDSFEGYNGTAWSSVGGGATGGGSDNIFYENGQNVTTNYTISTNKNAMSAGPITIDSGVTVTVPSGSTWTVV